MHRSFLCLTLCLFVFCSSADAQDAMLRKLDSKDADVRFDALLNLADLGPKAAPATDRLLAILTRFDENERVLAVIILGKIGKPAIPAIEKLLAHEDELTRHDAVWALALIGKDAKTLVPTLLRLSRTDPDPDVRSKAVYALTRIDPDDGKTLAALAKILRDDKTPPALQLSIVEQLRDWGEPAIPPLGEALRNDFTYLAAQSSLAHLLDKHRTKTAANAMAPFVVDAYQQANFYPAVFGRMVYPPAPGISELCDSEGMSFVLKTVGAKAMPALETKLSSKDADERKHAVTALGLMGRTLFAHNDAPELVERIVKKLVPLLRHEDCETRAAVASCMPSTKSSSRALHDAVIDEHPHVRMAAHRSLAFYLADPLSALRARLPKAKGAEQIRIAAPLATLNYEKPAEIILWGYLTDKDPALRHQAAYVLGTSQALQASDPGKLKKLLVPVLFDSLKSDDLLKRRQAAEGIAMLTMNLGARADALLSALQDKDADVRKHLLQAMRGQDLSKREDILKALLPFLHDPEPNTQVYAVHCFSHNGKLGPLLKMLAEEKEAYLRQRIIDCFMQHKDPRVLTALLKTAEKSDDWPSAAYTLIRLDEKACTTPVLTALGKRDEAVRLTLDELPQPPQSIDAALKNFAALLKRKEFNINRQAAHTIEQMAPLMYVPKTSAWLIDIQQALARRLPSLRAPLQSEDWSMRLATVELLVQFQAMQASLTPHMGRADRKEQDAIRALVDGNQQRIDALLNLARRDGELLVRRAARKAMRAAT